MSSLTAQHILQLIESSNLIEKPSYFTQEEWEERCKDIEGSQFDLTIDKLYAQSNNSNPYLGRYSRDTGNLVEVEPIYFSGMKEEGWLLYPESHYVGLTGETVNMPPYFRGILNGRSSCYVMGLYPGVTNISPGYSGKLKFGLFSVSGMHLGRGARVITMTITSFGFEEYPKIDNIQPYKGIWGGSKVSTDGTERAH